MLAPAHTWYKPTSPLTSSPWQQWKHMLGIQSEDYVRRNSEVSTGAPSDCWSRTSLNILAWNYVYLPFWWRVHWMSEAREVLFLLLFFSTKTIQTVVSKTNSNQFTQLLDRIPLDVCQTNDAVGHFIFKDFIHDTIYIHLYKHNCKPHRWIVAIYGVEGTSSCCYVLWLYYKDPPLTPHKKVNAIYLVHIRIQCSVYWKQMFWAWKVIPAFTPDFPQTLQGVALGQRKCERSN